MKFLSSTAIPRNINTNRVNTFQYRFEDPQMKEFHKLPLYPGNKLRLKPLTLLDKWWSSVIFKTLTREDYLYFKSFYDKFLDALVNKDHSFLDRNLEKKLHFTCKEFIKDPAFHSKYQLQLLNKDFKQHKVSLINQLFITGVNIERTQNKSRDQYYFETSARTTFAKPLKEENSFDLKRSLLRADIAYYTKKKMVVIDRKNKEKVVLGIESEDVYESHLFRFERQKDYLDKFYLTDVDMILKGNTLFPDSAGTLKEDEFNYFAE